MDTVLEAKKTVRQSVEDVDSPVVQFANTSCFSDNVEKAISLEKTSEAATQAAPKKRAIILTAFLACLSFLIFASNLIVSFSSDLIHNEMMWNHLALWIEKNNNKSVVNTKD